MLLDCWSGPLPDSLQTSSCPLAGVPEAWIAAGHEMEVSEIASWVRI